MIAAHKVLAAYGCLVPRLVAGNLINHAASTVAVDGKLLPWWRCDFANSRLPRCRDSASRNECRTLQLAVTLGRR